MYEQDECIFCFKTFSPNKSKGIHFDKDDVKSCENYIHNTLNDTLKLKCNHDFHVGCFIKYIRTKYTSWKKTSILDEKNIFHMSCPFCRSVVNNEELLLILDYLDPIKEIASYINNTLLKLKFRMGLIKLSVYSKKLFKVNQNINDTYKYFKMTESYENWEFLDTKIKVVTKDTDLLYKTLSKTRDDNFISRTDEYDWW